MLLAVASGRGERQDRPWPGVVSGCGAATGRRGRPTPCCRCGRRTHPTRGPGCARSAARAPRAPTRCEGRSGRVSPPPSVTSTSTTPALTFQCTRRLPSPSGRACRMAFDTSSETTISDSSTVVVGTPRAPRSSTRARRTRETEVGSRGRAGCSCHRSQERPPRAVPASRQRPSTGSASPAHSLLDPAVPTVSVLRGGSLPSGFHRVDHLTRTVADDGVHTELKHSRTSSGRSTVQT